MEIDFQLTNFQTIIAIITMLIYLGVSYRLVGASCKNAHHRRLRDKGFLGAIKAGILLVMNKI
jgi:hypothetical protein